ncbi:hypothetical protein DSO57_1019501 [Entomophthora muscae]|nr:hypothetical protein DSO57_1019501 [Entomophthora muscae]
MTARTRQGMVRPLIKNCFPKKWLRQEFSPGVTNFQLLEEASKNINENCPENTTQGEYSQFASTLLHNVPPHELKKVTREGVRCLVFHGSRDYIIRPIYGKLLSSFLSCPLVLFKKSGHMIMIERRDEFNAILQAHIEEKPLDAYLLDAKPTISSTDVSTQPRLVFSGISRIDSVKQSKSEFSGLSNSKPPLLTRANSLPAIKNQADYDIRLTRSTNTSALPSPCFKMGRETPKPEPALEAEDGGLLLKTQFVPKELRSPQAFFAKLKSFLPQPFALLLTTS